MSRTGPGFGRGHRPVTIALATFELVWPSLPHRSPIPRTSSPPPSSAGPRRVPSAPPSCVPRQRPRGGSPSSSAASPFALRERPWGSSGIDMPDCRRRARNQALLGPLGWRVSHPPAASEPGTWARACTCRMRCSASRGERATLQPVRWPTRGRPDPTSSWHCWCAPWRNIAGFAVTSPAPRPPSESTAARIGTASIASANSSGSTQKTPDPSSRCATSRPASVTAPPDPPGGPEKAETGARS